jgi:hypothetical protein
MVPRVWCKASYILRYRELSYSRRGILISRDVYSYRTSSIHDCTVYNFYLSLISIGFTQLWCSINYHLTLYIMLILRVERGYKMMTRIWRPYPEDSLRIQKTPVKISVKLTVKRSSATCNKTDSTPLIGAFLPQGLCTVPST